MSELTESDGVLGGRELVAVRLQGRSEGGERGIEGRSQGRERTQQRGGEAAEEHLSGGKLCQGAHVVAVEDLTLGEPGNEGQRPRAPEVLEQDASGGGEIAVPDRQPHRPG